MRVFGSHRRAWHISVFLLLWLMPLSVQAEEDASAQTFHPAIDTSKYFSAYGSQTMQQLQYRVGAYFNYALRPVEFGVGGVRRGAIIDDLLMADIFASLGITDWLQVGVDVPIAIWDHFFDPFSPLVPNAPGQNLTRMGDVRLEFKLRLLNDFEHRVGLALRPYITFPTGDGDKFVGNDSFTGGGDLIFDVHFWDRFFIALNLGYLSRESIRPAGLNVEEDDKVTYGLGLNVKAIEWMDVIAEIYGATLAGELFDREAEMPLELLGGLRFFPVEGLQIGVGAGAGLTFGYGSPDFRGLLEVSYTKPRVVELPPPVPEPPPVVRLEERKIVITQKIHFEFDKARIRPISFHILDAVVDVLRQHPEILKVQVEGHTDAVGSDAYNLRLSERRAKSVVAYLVSHGISRGRLVAKGFGESRFIDTNDTPIGRARNRRTEFTIQKRAGN